MVAEAGPIFLGTGGDKPQLVVARDAFSNPVPLKITEFPRGNSVYALAVSHDGQRLAAATRKGRIQAFVLDRRQSTAGGVSLFEGFHVPGVASLAFITGDLVASGGLDGQVQFWRISQNSRVATKETHDGAVLAMCRIGSLLLATLGADAVLRIWDLDTLDAIFTRCQINLPALGAQTSLHYDPTSALLLHPTSTGELYVYDMTKDCELRTVPAHQGGFSAIAVDGLHVATAGHDDGILKIWSRILDRVEFEAPVGSGIVSLAWVNEQTIATIDRAGNGRLWSLGGRPGSNTSLDGIHYRCCRGLPVEVVVPQRHAAARHWFHATIEEAKSVMGREDSESKRRLSLILGELARRELGAEVELIKAEVARAEQNALAELEALMTLSRALGTTAAAVPTLYRLGDLLERFHEPALAADAFHTVVSIEPSYEDACQRLKNLQLTTNHETATDLVRGDLAQLEAAAKEISKCTILGRRFASPILLETRQPCRIDASVNPSDFSEALKTQLDGRLTGHVEVNTRAVRVQAGSHVQDGDWIYIQSTDQPTAIGLAICPAPSGCELTTHLLFDPCLLNLPTPREHNHAVEKALVAVMRAAAAKGWFREVEHVAAEAFHHLRNHVLSQDSEGLF